MSTLQQLQEKASMFRDVSSLNLEDINIDSSKPVNDRIMSFISDIKNPYVYRVGDIIVNVTFGMEKSLEDSMTRIILNA